MQSKFKVNKVKLTFDQIVAAASRFRQLEVVNLKRENAVMRAELALAPKTRLPEPAATLPEPAAPAVAVPTNMLDGIKQVINGTPLNSYELYTHVKSKFPQIRGGWRMCRAKINDLRKIGFLVSERGPKKLGQHGGSIPAKYRKA